MAENDSTKQPTLSEVYKSLSYADKDKVHDRTVEMLAQVHSSLTVLIPTMVFLKEALEIGEVRQAVSARLEKEVQLNDGDLQIRLRDVVVPINLPSTHPAYMKELDVVGVEDTGGQLHCLDPDNNAAFNFLVSQVKFVRRNDAG